MVSTNTEYEDGWNDGYKKGYDTAKKEIRCTCDDIGDSPCPKHQRENELQDLWLKEKNENEELKKKLVLESIEGCGTLAQIKSMYDTLRIKAGELSIENKKLKVKESLNLAFIKKLQDGIFNLYNEVDCRIEHGADEGGRGHLEYVRKKLKEILG